MKSACRLPLLTLFSSITLSTLPTEAATVITDNFDTGAASSDWDVNANTAILSSGAQSTSNAIHLNAAPNNPGLGESFSAVSPGGTDNFIIDYYFRVQTSANRQFSLLVSTNSTAPATNSAALNLRYQTGTWAAFSTSGPNAFVSIPTSGANSLPAVTPDVWYHMQVEGIGWGSGTATYTLRLSDAGGSTFTNTASGLTYNQTSAGPGMSVNKAQSFLFNTAFGTNPGFDIDNVTVTLNAVPEPAAPLLAGAGLLLLARRRRA